MNLVFVRSRLLPVVLGAAVIFSSQSPFIMTPVAQETESTDDTILKTSSYNAYLQEQEQKRPDFSVTLSADDVTDTSANFIKMPIYNGERDVMLQQGEENGHVTYSVDIPESGLYTIAIKYAPHTVSRGRLELNLLLDGELPFKEASGISLPRLYTDKEGIKSDVNGHDIRPETIELDWFNTVEFIDTEGFGRYSYEFYLGKGRHTLRIESVGAPIAVKSLFLYGRQSIPSYTDVLTGWQGKGARPVESISENVIRLQAEGNFYRTDSTLTAMSDRTDPKTEPFEIGKIKLNYMGGYNWSRVGQKVVWKLYAPSTGLYKLAFRYRQNYQRGLSTVRRISIDGSVPFAEFDAVEFPFNQGWSLNIPSDDKGNPYYIYLEQGEHTISLECTQSPMAEHLQSIETAVYEMNELYRKVIMVTSVQPDIFRDYMLEKEIPDLKERLSVIKGRLRDEYASFSEWSPEAAGEAAILLRTADVLDIVSEDPEQMKEYLSEYKNNVSAIASWLLYMKTQPLDLDYISCLPPDAPEPVYKAGFFESAKVFVMSFIASFFEDYSSIGGSYKSSGQAITVWTEWGRDQASIIKQLVDNDFTQKSGIKVNVKLVQSSLINAILAGVGPDVAINVGRGQPVNLAMRGAVADLMAMKNFNEIKTRFSDTALAPYTYNGSVYGLPVTQSFFMMFYRKDIFDDLNLKPPQTMDELYDVLSVLQRNNMEIAMPFASPNVQSLVDSGMGSRNMFITLLMQKGGSVYTEDLKYCALDSKEAVEAFKQWTDLYTKYKLPLYYDFFNRFRTGEMPLGIADYTVYNMLELAAPEIRGCWEMLPIPGIPDNQGNINRAQGASGTSVIVLSGAQNKESCFEFLDWWTSDDTQLTFGLQMEAVTGPGGRYATANINAFKQLPWRKAEKENILSQWRYVREIEEIPGGYYTSRSLENAFAEVYYNRAVPRDALASWIEKTNDEIRRKRSEFGLE